MTSCTVDVCGTGSWTGALPGDPDVNNSVLSATAAFGGIDVSWIYPGINPHAVAHTLLYRSIWNDFTTAIQRAVVAGNVFYDRVDANQQYFYWIKIVSVNGTVGNLIGPASATARLLIADLIGQLSGQINDSFLAQALKTRIDKITLDYAELQAEILARLNSETILSMALSDVQAGTAQTLAFVGQEITTRANGDTAMAQQISTIAAMNSTNAAAILSEQTARVTEDSALATRIDSVVAASGGGAAAVTAETTARIAADAVLAGQITTAQSTLNGNIASVQTNLQTNINTTNGKVTAIGALYTVKVDVNGLVGGFGVYNDGSSVVAGFDVTQFWVGSAASRRKPFIIQNGETFIDQAVINKLTFSKLTDEAGTFVVAAGKVKANYIDTNGLIIRDGAGNPIFGAGYPITWSDIASRPAFGVLAGQNTVTVAQVSDAGALASQNYASIGSTVRFPDGTVLNTTSFVNALSKISNGNINTFMDGAAITSAYIGNAEISNAHIQDAAITNAKIDNLSISTLKIQGNAVTVPVGQEGYGTIPTLTIVLTEPGTIFVTVVANAQPSGTVDPGNDGHFYVAALCNSTLGPITTISMAKLTAVGGTAIGTFPVGAGSHSVSGRTLISGGSAVVTVTGIFAIGVKR